MFGGRPRCLQVDVMTSADVLAFGMHRHICGVDGFHDGQPDRDTPLLPPVPYALSKAPGMAKGLEAEAADGDVPAALMHRYLDIEQDRYLPAQN